MRQRFSKFMQGRYGNDQLNKFLMIILMFCLALSFFAGNAFYLFGLFLLFYVYLRMLSRNIDKRSAENGIYLRFRDKIRNNFMRRKRTLLQRKTHHIYHCPSCKQKIRVPRGKGKVVVSCPKCGTEFVKRS